MAKKELSEYVGKEEAAKLLSVSTRTVDRYVKKGILKRYVRVIGHKKSAFRRSDIQELLGKVEPDEE